MLKPGGNTGGKHRRKRKDLTKTRGSTETIYRRTNEGMRCRWREAGRGQVREKEWKNTGGREITQREELKSNA